jgi:carbonic anhydrase/acetyltransferase-like protein (isoleucine patch superfamily)
MDRSDRRRSLTFRPGCEPVEGRLLLSTVPSLVNPHRPYLHPLGYPAVRPNTPVLPYAATKDPTFIDPSAGIIKGQHVIVGIKSFIGPFARLDASSGYIKIGNGSAVLDNATIISNSGRKRNPTTSVQIGDNTSIGFGATVLGPSRIGAYTPKGSKTAVPPTGIGPNALIDGATISPGSIVGALARVGPGVVVPSGVYVLPGANVTTSAQAANPALGKVVAVTPQQLDDLTQSLSDTAELATGYTTLYQGDSATGLSPGVDPSVKGVNNGNLTAVEGASNEPGVSNGVDFETAKPTGPTFLAPLGQQQPGLIPTFRARVTGQVVFHQHAAVVAHSLGFGDAIRADSGQPFTFGSSLSMGNDVTMNSPLSSADSDFGQITIYDNFVAQDRSVILGGPKVNVVLGANTNIGPGAVVVGSSLGTGVTIGARAYVADSNLAANARIPAGAIIIGNVFKGFVQW